MLDHWLDKCLISRSPTLAATGQSDDGGSEEYSCTLPPALTMLVTQYQHYRGPAFWRTTAEAAIAAISPAPLIMPPADASLPKREQS